MNEPLCSMLKAGKNKKSFSKNVCGKTNACNSIVISSSRISRCYSHLLSWKNERGAGPWPSCLWSGNKIGLVLTNMSFIMHTRTSSNQTLIISLSLLCTTFVQNHTYSSKLKSKYLNFGSIKWSKNFYQHKGQHKKYLLKIGKIFYKNRFFQT